MDRKFLRPGWIVGHLLVVLAVLVCLRLGRWQWDRMHEGGTIQNFGYAVLWPVFGAAFVYMWFRFLQLEMIKDAEDDEELTEMASGGGELATSSDGSQIGVTRTSTTSESSFESGAPVKADLTEVHVPSTSVRREPDDALSDDLVTDVADPETSAEVTAPPAARRSPSRAYTVAVSTVGDENEDNDPELAAYNRALAALAAKDHRRAR